MKPKETEKTAKAAKTEKGATKPSSITKDKRTKDETDGTVSPQSIDKTQEGSVSAHEKHTISGSGVTTEKAIDTTVIEAVPSVRDKILAARKAPEEVADRPPETDNLRNAADDATPADNNSSAAVITHGDRGSATEIPLMTSWDDHERKIWEQRLNQYEFGEVFASDTGLEYHVLWVNRRPYIRLDDVEKVVGSALESFYSSLEYDLLSEGYLSEIDCSGFDSFEVDLSESQVRRLKRFADWRLYLPLDDAINLIAGVGDLYHDVHDLCALRNELEDRCPASGDPSEI